MLRLEVSLDEGVECLKRQLKELGSDHDELYDDTDESMRVSFTINGNSWQLSSSQQTQAARFETVQNRLSEMEKENLMLRQEVAELQAQLLAYSNGSSGDGSSTNTTEPR